MEKIFNALNSATLYGINAGILHIDGSYIKRPGVVVKNVKISPGLHKVAVAAYLGNGRNFYDELSFDFKANEKYIVSIEPYGSKTFR